MSSPLLESPRSGDEGRFGRSLALGAILGLVVLAVLAGWADVPGVGAVLSRFPLHVAALACALACATYGLRYVR